VRKLRGGEREKNVNFPTGRVREKMEGSAREQQQNHLSRPGSGQMEARGEEEKESVSTRSAPLADLAGAGAGASAATAATAGAGALSVQRNPRATLLGRTGRRHGRLAHQQRAMRGHGICPLALSIFRLAPCHVMRAAGTRDRAI